MSLTPSQMLPLDTIAPDFTLLDTVSGQTRSLEQLRSPTATMIMFICNHCPYVKHLQQGLVKLAEDYQSKELAIIAISANDADNYPEDGPDQMKHIAKDLGYQFPYLYDETQAVAKAYQAACTPDFYLFDHQLACVYRGQFDDSRPENDIPVTGYHLRQAIDNCLSGKPISSEQKPSIGCNIKWKQ